jgi:hypothetical protein
LVGSAHKRRLGRANGIEKLTAGQEHDAGAGEREHPSAPTRVGREIMLAALHRADRDRIDHQERLEAGFDREQAADFAEHGPHSNG